MLFGTDTPAKSKKSQLGLFHGKTHHQRKKRVFSMKYRIETAKPNIYKKKLHSDIMGKTYQLWISMKTRKCIMKAGSFDNYILNTQPKKMDSKFGLFLRQQMLLKQKNPLTYLDVYIPGTAPQNKTRKTKKWQYR